MQMFARFAACLSMVVVAVAMTACQSNGKTAAACCATENCCEAAAKAGKTCEATCCVDAAKAGTVCKMCAKK